MRSSSPQLDPQRSVLTMLRALVPDRDLTPSETLRIAELQANRLLQHFETTGFDTLDELIAEMPRIRVVREHDLAVSAATYWDGHTWVIALNASEPRVRQRFSCLHEYKHILDHTSKDRLYHDRHGQTADQQAERVADYFAACALMPKRIVKSLWCQSDQNLTSFAHKLGVSTRALSFRLNDLGLTEPSQRCHRNDRRPGTHRRQWTTRPLPQSAGRSS